MWVCASEVFYYPHLFRKSRCRFPPSTFVVRNFVPLQYVPQCCCCLLTQKSSLLIWHHFSLHNESQSASWISIRWASQNLTPQFRGFIKTRFKEFSNVSFSDIQHSKYDIFAATLLRKLETRTPSERKWARFALSTTDRFLLHFKKKWLLLTKESNMYSNLAKLTSPQRFGNQSSPPSATPVLPVPSHNRSGWSMLHPQHEWAEHLHDARSLTPKHRGDWSLNFHNRVLPEVPQSRESGDGCRHLIGYLWRRAIQMLIHLANPARSI